MRKFIFILTFLASTIILSCSSDDDNSSQNFINPPDWILGTWMDESEPVFAQIGGFQFTQDNLISLASNGDVLTDLKNGLQDGFDAGVIDTNETITDSLYELEIISSGTVTNSFRFSRGTDNQTIVYDLSVTYDVVLTKQ